MTTPSIFKSRKFWIMTCDVIVSLATYFITKYASPDAAKDALTLIGALQPIVLLVVGSMTVQNLKAMVTGSKEEKGDDVTPTGG